MSVKPGPGYDIVFNDYFKSQLVTLLTGYGYAVGYKPFNGPQFINQQWDLNSDGKGKVAFWNVATKTYLGPKDHDIVGTTEKYLWQLVPKSAPLSGYYIKTTDGGLTWFLPNGIDGTRIELKPRDNIHEEDEAKAEWAYRPV